MKISPELIVYVNSNPTKETRQRTIFDLCKSIDDGMITLPLYQRDLSWTMEKSVSLLNYQLSGKAPVSAISINLITKPEDAVEQVTFIDREIVEVKSGLNSVVDGQQRITTNYKAYSDSEDFRKIVLDVGKGKFLYLEDEEEIKRNQIPVGVLLNKDNTVMTKYLEKHKPLASFEVQNVLLQARKKFENYNYTINQASDLNEEEQIVWFEVLNNAGSRVSRNEMKLAKLKVYGVDIYKQYAHPYVDKIKAHGYDEVFLQQTTNLSYPLSSLNPAYEVITKQPHSSNNCPMAPDCRPQMICGMEPNGIKKAFQISLVALDKALNFIDEHNLRRPTRIDYINFLMGYFVFHPEPQTNEDEGYLIDWYRDTYFTNTSNTDRRRIFTKLIEKA